MAVVLVLSLALLAVLSWVVHGGSTPSWDRSILHALRPLARVEPVHVALRLVFDLGGAPVQVTVVAALAAWILWRHRRADVLLLVAATGGATLLEVALKRVVKRPTLQAYQYHYSFPSGHSAAVVALAAAAALLWPERRREIAFAGAAVAAGVAVGAVALRYHYPSDILGGWCLAIAWVATLSLAWRRWRA